MDMPDDGKIYELHNGVLIEVAGSKVRQSRLAMWLGRLLINFIEDNELGGMVTGPDGSAILNEYNTRIPDVAYISAARAKKQDDESYIDGAPDLAIEVVSPSNSPSEMQQRAGEYLSAGARLVWIVNPTTRTVDVYGSHGSRTVMNGEDMLDGGEVLLGLRISVKQVFKTLGE
jgi:Uma2 family endonuclease